MSCGHDILYGPTRISVPPSGRGSPEARTAFLIQLDNFADDWAVLQTADDCAWAVGKVFEAARVYVAAAGAFPVDHPDSVHQLLTSEDNPGIDGVEGLSFLACMPLQVQAWCNGVRELERGVWLNGPISSRCQGLALSMRGLDASHQMVNSAIDEVAEYLELVARHLALSS